MTTIRGVKDRRFQFVQLLNSMFDDENLSLKSKGFIGFCLTKPSDWRFSVIQMCGVLKEGEKAIYSVIQECVENGYAYRYQPRADGGTFLGWELAVSDSKEEIAEIKKEIESIPEFKKCSPHAGFRDAVKRDAVKRDADNGGTTNTEETNTEKNKTDKQQLSVVAAVAAPLQEEENEEDEEKESLKNEGCELPKVISIANHRGQRQEITQTQLYELIIRNKCDFHADAIRYAWKVLCDYTGPIGDWWRFFSGTATNYVRLKKSKTIKQQHQGDRRCQKETQTQRTSSAGSSESDSSAPPFQKSQMSIAELRKQLQNSLSSQKTASS